MSKNMQGTVKDLFVSSKAEGRKNPNVIEIDYDGIKGDKFYAKSVERSILIASLDSYTLALSKGISMLNGSLGENILIDLNPYSLKNGDKISVGEVILEITQNCTICNSLSKVDNSLPELLKSDRGIFAKTFKSGKIKKGDKVCFL